MKEKKRIENISFNVVDLEEEYYNCLFEKCDFSNMRINDVYFENCEFISCNFSLTKFCNNLRDCIFTECKMTGADFSRISKFALTFKFQRCLLSYVSFTRVKMKGIEFIECNLNEAFFDYADIASSSFDKCDLSRTTFFETNLERVNFSTSYNFSINPNQNKLKKAIFSETGLRGLLSYLDIDII